MYNSKTPVQKQLVRQRKFQQRPQKRTFLLMVTEILHFHQETKKLGQRRFTEDNCSSNCLQTCDRGEENSCPEKPLFA